MCFFKKKETKKAPAKKAPAKVKKETTQKVPEKKVVKKENKNNETRVYHVVKREDGKWTVKFAKGEKVIKLFDTQKEAIEYTKVMAKNQDGKMLIHNSKGKDKGRIKSK